MGLNDPPIGAKRVRLGWTFGNSDKEYYLYENGEVFVWESPNNGYSPARWDRLPEDRWDACLIEGQTVRQLAEEKRGKWDQEG